MPRVLRPTVVTRVIPGSPSAKRRTYPPTIPVAPTMTSRFGATSGALMSTRASSPSGKRAILEPVHIESALSKQPRPALLGEAIRVAQRSNHQASLLALDAEVVGEAVR